MNKEEIAKSIDEGLKILKQESSFIFHPEEIKTIEYLRKHVIPYNNINGNIEFLVNETALNLISKLQKELKEKTTILLAGADKVKQLEKENEELKSKKQLEIDTSEEVLKWKGKYHLLSRENEELKEKLKEYEIGMLKE